MRAKFLIIFMTCVFAILAMSPGLTAQSTKSPSPTKPSATGVKPYEKGTRLFESGKYDASVNSLTTALSAGGLTSQQMAKALYYRGLSYRKQGKNALAISDLTSAIWLKSGLSDTERAVAMDQRQAAYREAGLGEGLAMGSPPLDSPPLKSTIAEVKDQKIASVSTGALSSNQIPNSAWTSGTSSSSRSKAQEVSPSSTLHPSSEASMSAQPQNTPSTPKALPPTQQTMATDINQLINNDNNSPSTIGIGEGQSIGASGSSQDPSIETVVGFLENMFGFGTGASSKTSLEETSTLATSSTHPVTISQTIEPFASQWSTNTSQLPSNTKKIEKSTSQKEKLSRASEDNSKDKYRLQVAILRSREKAEGLAAELRQKYAHDFGSAVTAIDEIVYGNMGKFYRVQLGPYANAADPAKVCTLIKPQGYDCMVVTR